MRVSLYADCRACNEIDQGYSTYIWSHGVRNSNHVERKSRRAETKNWIRVAERAALKSRQLDNVFYAEH